MKVRDFGELLVRAQRDNGKVLVRDVGFRKEIELERGQEEKRFRAAAPEFQPEQKIDPGPKIDRGHGRSRQT